MASQNTTNKHGGGGLPGARNHELCRFARLSIEVIEDFVCGFLGKAMLDKLSHSNTPRCSSICQNGMQLAPSMDAARRRLT
eukprot:2601561-Rhodomonas_salina.1